MIEILRHFAPQNDMDEGSVMLNPFDFAQAKLREASRFSKLWVLLARNEILRHFAPQTRFVNTQF